MLYLPPIVVRDHSRRSTAYRRGLRQIASSGGSSARYWAAMSQENVELVRRMYADFGLTPSRVEAAARAGLIAPDVAFDYSALYPDGPVLRGIAAWRDHA